MTFPPLRQGPPSFLPIAVIIKPLLLILIALTPTRTDGIMPLEVTLSNKPAALRILEHDKVPALLAPLPTLIINPLLREPSNVINL